MRLEASHVRCARECLHEKMLFRMIRIRLDVALGLFKSSVLLTKGAPIARTAEMGILKVTHRHSHAASETEIGANLRETGTPSHQLTVVEQPIRLRNPKSEREQNFETHYRSV